MDISNLTKYIPVAYPKPDGFSEVSSVNMEPWKTGGYVKFEDVVELLKQPNNSAMVPCPHYQHYHESREDGFNWSLCKHPDRYAWQRHQ